MHNSKRLYVLCSFCINRGHLLHLCKDRVKMFKTNIVLYIISGWVGKICIQYARHLVCIIIVCCQLWMWDEFTDIVFVRLFSLFFSPVYICFAFGYFIMLSEDKSEFWWHIKKGYSILFLIRFNWMICNI